MEQEGGNDEVKRRNRIRGTIKEFFPDKKCFTLCRPVSDESTLEKLS